MHLRVAAERRPGPHRGTLTSGVELLVVVAVYYLSARLSLHFALIQRNVTPLWPPTGIAVVAFLWYGRRMWPAIALAAFLVNEPISASWLAALVTAAGNTLAPFVAAELLHRVGFRKEIDRLYDAIAIVLAALGSSAISATIGATTLVVSDVISATRFPSAWAVWWTGDAMGVLVVAPFLLSLLSLRREAAVARGSWRRRAEAACLFVILTVLSLAVFHSRLRLLFVLFPFLGWAAWRFQQRGAAPAALLVTGMAGWAAARGLGPFAEGGLFTKMLTLQAFNATAAFTSFVFAAMVSERMRARRALELAAARLEERVQLRTAELSTANQRLRQQIEERRAGERLLRRQERQLAEAQQVAKIGSWEWLVEEDLVTWSDEMYRIHGHRPQAFPVSFQRAVEQVLPQDLPRIQRAVTAAIASRRDQDLPADEYRIRRLDGAERILLGKARLAFGAGGTSPRMLGTVQDITEEKQAQREHRIAETLQRSLLPDRLPEIPGVEFAARYVPATADVEVGGDWYDVMQLPDGRVCVAIGDVAGHGLRAASTMGQLRMALRAYALEDPSPAGVVTRIHQLVQKQMAGEMATLIFLVFDPESGVVTFANAGHPPPLLIPEEGPASYRQDGLAPPVGAAASPHAYEASTFTLSAGTTLLLYTDGLIERRGVSLRHGLDRLREEAVAAGADLDALSDRLLGSMVGEQVSDDVALLAMRPVLFGGRSLTLRVPAEPSALAPLRHALRRWLREVDAEPQETYEILVAVGEACANAIVHPYGAKEGFLEVSLGLVEREVDVRVRDFGTWRPYVRSDAGRGLQLMLGLMDDVDVESGMGGTVVRMRRRLRAAVR